ncbi:MAG: ureidoglycolate lyase [Alphaproteobacteria bacterium]
MDMIKETLLAVEPVSVTAFAPFGELLLRPEGEPSFRGIQASSWPTCFACVDGVQLMYVRFGWQEPLFTKFERHRGITQTFVALMPRRFVMVVAPPAAAGDWPDIDAVRAFLIPPGAAVIIGDGIWHALDRFLPEREALDCLMLTSAGVQAELEAQYQGGGEPRRTDVVDYAARGRQFRLDLPS